MPKTKQISFQYSINENISLEVNGIGTDNEIPAVVNEPDDVPHYEFVFSSVFLNGQDILPILDALDATEKIYNEAIKQCWKEFNK